MGLFKSRGKHAHGVHAPSAEGQPVEDEERAPEDSEQEEAAEVGSALPENGRAGLAEPVNISVDAPVAESPDEPILRIEDFSDAAARSLGETAGDTAPNHDWPATSGYIPTTSDGVTLHKKRRMGKALGITFGVVIGVALVAYIAGAVMFMGRFLPGTFVIDQDISMMTDEEVADLLEGKVGSYTIDVVGNGFSYRATGKDIDLAVDSSAVIADMHEALNAWTWPALLAEGGHDVSGSLSVSFREQGYNAEVSKAVETFNQTATPPVDATIVYDEASGKYKVKSEEIGTQYDSKAILAAMGDAIAELNPKVALDGTFLVQPSVLSTDERLVSSAEVATAMTTANVTLKMSGQVVSQIDGEELSQFVRMDDDFNVTFDDAAFDQWVTALSNGFDTVGTERTYTRADGKVITVSGGAYGWSTDAAAVKDQVVAAIKEGATTELEIPCERAAAVYSGPGQRDWGNRYIDVDLSEQYVRFYGDDGSIIWESACISGSPDGEHNTWPGVWYITNMQSPSKLVGYLPSGKKEYETTVSYWMAFEGNGIGFHDATWQPSFGGSLYANGYGSHGCINLPYSAAQSLYGICQVGDVVIAHF